MPNCVRLDMVWIWYQLLPNFTICNLHPNTHPCVWYQLLPNRKLRHLNLNTHPCGSCTRNAHFVVRSNRSEIFIVFCMLRSSGSWILRILDPSLLFYRGILEILDPKLLFGPGILANWFCHGILYFATLCHVALRHRARLDMVWIWYQLLPNPTMCHLRAS